MLSQAKEQKELIERTVLEPSSSQQHLISVLRKLQAGTLSLLITYGEDDYHTNDDEGPGEHKSDDDDDDADQDTATKLMLPAQAPLTTPMASRAICGKLASCFFANAARLYLHLLRSEPPATRARIAAHRRRRWHSRSRTPTRPQPTVVAQGRCVRAETRAALGFLSFAAHAR